MKQLQKSLILINKSLKQTFKNILLAIIILSFSQTTLANGINELNEGDILKSTYINEVIVNTDNSKAQTNEILVKYKNESKSAYARQSIQSRSHVASLKHKKKLKNSSIDVFEVNSEDEAQKAIAELKMNPNVEIAQPNYRYSALSTVSDSLFNLQWGLKNTGQTITAYYTDGTHADFPGVAGIDINVMPAWDTTMGSSDLIIGVLDTGIDINHTQLADNIYRNTNEISGNGIDDDNNGYVDDINGWDFYHEDNSVYDTFINNNSTTTYDYHGTHVAGIIAAKADTAGVRGVAPNVKILPLKFLDDANSGLTSDAIEAISYAKNMGIQIANCSWGGDESDPLLYNAMRDSGILFICAAGNNGKNLATYPMYPASYDLANILTVAAIDNKGALASFSNYGTAVDVAAPGRLILSTYPGNAYPSNAYKYMDGTSMATPFVTGIAALLKSYKPSITTSEIIAAIKENTKYNSNIIGKVNTNGMVDAYKALDSIIPAVPIANAGINQYTFKGFTVTLDGSKSFKEKGDPLQYNWTFVSKPEGSQCVLNDADLVNPYFIPDVIGDYVITLTVNNGLADSLPTQVRVKAKRLSDSTDNADLDLMGIADKSYLDGYSFNDAVPLTDGWMILGDVSKNKIVIVNALTGEVGREFALQAAPQKIDVDFRNNIIVATQSGLNKIAKIDLNSGLVTYINTLNPNIDIVVGTNNNVFAYSSFNFSIISTKDNVEVKTLTGPFAKGLMVYNSDNGTLFLSNNDYNSSLYSYAYNNTLQTLEKQQEVTLGYNNTDLSISNDGKHLALVCGGGNGNGYYVYDIDSSNLTNRFGEWYLGAYPTSLYFSKDNRYVVTTNSSEVKIFAVDSHTLISTTYIAANNVNKVYFSRGGKIAFAGQGSSSMTRIYVQRSGVLPSYEIGDIFFTTGDENDLPVSKLNGNSKMQANIKITKNDASITGKQSLIIALYDSENTLVSCKTEEVDLSSLPINVPQVLKASILLSDYNVSSGYRVKAFLWNSMNDLEPIKSRTETPEIPYN